MHVKEQSFNVIRTALLRIMVMRSALGHETCSMLATGERRQKFGDLHPKAVLETIDVDDVWKQPRKSFKQVASRPLLVELEDTTVRDQVQA